MAKADIESMLHETREFTAPQEFAAAAHISTAEEYDSLIERAGRDPEAFWAEIAAELDWFTPWDSVLEWKPPFAKWFVGATTNLSYNCLDRHLNSWRRNKAAIIWEGEPGDSVTLTYQELHREVCKFANVLKGLGVGKGDRVGIYLPMIPEAAITMLACARIGATHSVVFGGFSSEALRDRMNDAQAKLVVTADGSYRRGGVVPLKKNVDAALEESPSVEKVVVVRRTGDTVPIKSGRDHWWHDLIAEADDQCEAEPLDAEHPLFILYTSGTTGKPKGVVHTTGGYMVLRLPHEQAGCSTCTRIAGRSCGAPRTSGGSPGIQLCGVRHPRRTARTSTLMYEGAPELHPRPRPASGTIVEQATEVTQFSTPRRPPSAPSCKWGR